MFGFVRKHRKATKNQKFENIEKHLYRRQYQTAAGEWSTLYYGIFTDWKKRRRTFPLGSKLKAAREELTILEARNTRKEDFDAVKVQGITIRAWGESYFATKVDPGKHAGGVERERRSFKTLIPFFGVMLLADIRRTRIMEYRAKRLNEPIMRRGKPAMINGAP